MKGLLVFQQREKNERIAGVSATGKFTANGVAAKEGGKTKQVLDEVVSGIRMMGEWRTGMFLEMGRNGKC
jgi:hypothetical protein